MQTAQDRPGIYLSSVARLMSGGGQAGRPDDGEGFFPLEHLREKDKGQTGSRIEPAGLYLSLLVESQLLPEEKILGGQTTPWPEEVKKE